MSTMMKIISATMLSLLLLVGATGAVSVTKNKPDTTTGEWELLLEGGQTTYTTIVFIAKGSGNLKLQAKSTGTQPIRVTLQSTDYPKYGAILDKTVHPGGPLNWIKNGGGVPSGAYVLQVHGSTANPKGIVYLKSAESPW